MDNADQAPIVPRYIQIRYPGRRCNGVPANTVPQYYLAQVDVNTATGLLCLPSGNAPNFGGTKNFNEAALALFNIGVPNPTNKTALDTLANQIAADFLNWNTCTHFDKVYDHCLDLDMNGLYDYVIFRMDVNDCSTRTLTAPYNGQPEELMHHDPANAACVDTSMVVTDAKPCVEFYGPPGSCSGGHISLTRYKLCLEDGRLRVYYLSTDTF